MQRCKVHFEPSTKNSLIEIVCNNSELRFSFSVMSISFKMSIKILMVALKSMRSSDNSRLINTHRPLRNISKEVSFLRCL